MSKLSEGFYDFLKKSKKVNLSSKEKKLLKKSPKLQQIYKKHADAIKDIDDLLKQLEK